MLKAGGEQSSAKGYDWGMGALLALPLAAMFGLAAGFVIAGLILLAPLAFAYDFIRRHLPRRAPRLR